MTKQNASCLVTHTTSAFVPSTKANETTIRVFLGATFHFENYSDLITRSMAPSILTSSQYLW